MVGGLVKPITAPLRRRSTKVDLTKLNDEKKEEADGELVKPVTAALHN